MTPENLVEWRRVLRKKLKTDATMYIDAIIFNSNYEKGRAHWDMVETLCEYTTGEIIDLDSSLYKCLHTVSQKITDNLGSVIGLEIVNGFFKEHTATEIDIMSTKLTDKLIEMIEDLLGDKPTMTRKTEKDIPKKLVPPVRGF